MKVTLINHSDVLGGASTVTFRLMEALSGAGVDARMLVVHDGSGDSRVVKAASSLRAKMPFLAEHLRIFTHNGFSRKTLFKISIATDGLPLSRYPLVLDADVVVLNWINQGMLSLDEIARIAAAKPLVWTMHDMWNLTGVCHHAGDCNRFTSRCHDCPLLGSCAGKNDLSTQTFDRKARLYGSAGIHFVAVSSWLEDKARQSALTRDCDLRMINNPFPVNTISRQKIAEGLPAEGKVILMCAARLDDPVKNLPMAIEVLNALQDAGEKATAVFVGELRDPRGLDGLRMPRLHLGPVYDKSRLSEIFGRADVVLSSSVYESFGSTLLEGQAAGATPVGYIHDGRADIITDGITGYAAGEGLRSLDSALSLALRQPIPESQLREAAARYSYEAIAARYINLFKEII